MESEKLSQKYSVRRLEKVDLNSILHLMSREPVFYRYHPPSPTEESILEDMAALPPGKTYTDKFYIGFWEQDSLIAVMDLILGYPGKHIGFIGFFMVDIAVQGHGVGSRIIQEVLEQLTLLGFREVQLGIDRGNPQSEHFWSRNGFTKTGREYTDDTVTYVYMKRNL